MAIEKFALLAGLLFALTACQPSTKGIAENIKSRLQSRFDSEPEFKRYHLSVSEVNVIHEEGNRYRGLATVSMNAIEHNVNLKILDDGDHGMYELEPGAFNFWRPRVLDQKIRIELAATHAPRTCPVTSA